MDDLQFQIRGQVIRFLSGEVGARTLYDWLIRTTWEVERRAPSQTAKLARGLQLLLEEYQHGDCNEEELKGELRGLIGIVGEQESTTLLVGSSSDTVRVEIAIGVGGPTFTAESKSAGRSLETASG